MAAKPPSPLPPIQFAALADALLARAHQLVPAWLPGGAQQGHEYKVRSIWRDEKTASLSVAVAGNRAGQWADFGGTHRGGDLIALYAAIHGLDMGHAAVQLARDLGLEAVAGVQPAPPGVQTPAPRPPPPAPPPGPARRKAESEGWSTVLPVPHQAPVATFWHPIPERSLDAIEHTAEYRVGNDLFGYVVRFRTSTGGKDTLPYTWCTSARDGASKWHWRTWDEPRPLYFPSHRLPEGRTVILVEGEKKADVLQALLDVAMPGIYCVASWSGGCKAWRKSLWDWLAGCTVLAWPDCDAKREQLTKAERDHYVDEAARAVVQASKPFLPAHKQGGMAAMLGIGALLRDSHACQVQMLPIPAPSDVADGWDCADAILTDGWDADRVLALFGAAQPLVADASAPAAAPSSGGAGDGSPPKPTARDGLANAGDDDDAFREHIEFICDQLKCKPHELGVNRKLIIAALRKAPGLKDCLGFNELTGGPCTQQAWPWREEAGPLKDTDDLRLGDYLSSTYKLKPASRAALAEAIDTVADEIRFHPIRDWLNGLTWDGKPRLDKWLMHVLDINVDTLPERKRKYLELVSRFWLIGMVARVMEPGCKFDYSLILEGRTGRRKSTMFKVLAGKAFFSDTHFDIGAGKDGFEQLEGLWVYELSELTALRKADSEQVKQFFSSEVDRFRGAYGRYVQAHPRQCVIGCSTNKRQYLYDLTGNRRYWPVWVEAPIKIEWLAKWRDLLFAEALQAYRAGEPYSPTLQQEEQYFLREQEMRLVETAVQSRLYQLLAREGGEGGEGKEAKVLSQHTKFVTLDQLVHALGTDAAKSTSQLEGQIRGWLEQKGWTYGREGSGLRRYGYRQPRHWPPEIEDDDDDRPPAGDGPQDDDRQAQADDSEGDDDLPI
ncbi:MAG: VapE domain-containing protein [Ramlibacter sp.]